ncbi:MAG: hypothetical protein LUC91_10490 [Prevotella sp.]|nr:hypothetical protein [Prevotella sp.]
MKNIKYIFNIDKLKVCYSQPREVFDEMLNYRTDQCIKYKDFKLFVTDDGIGTSKNPKGQCTIHANVILPDRTELGEFTFTRTEEEEGYCFFLFANSVLYKESEKDGNGTKMNYMVYLPDIANSLGLTFHNISEVEIACDVNFNAIRKIRALIRNTEQVEMIINRKKVNDGKDIIEKYHEEFSRSRKRLDHTPSIYIKQGKTNGPTLRIYNKSEEIENSSHKDYIDDWNGFDCIFHRLEVVVKNDTFKGWISFVRKMHEEHPEEYPQEWGMKENSFLMLMNPEYRKNLWKYIAEKLLYFRLACKRNRRITLLDIVTGTFKKL